jgi:hypothetical protein
MSAGDWMEEDINGVSWWFDEADALLNRVNPVNTDPEVWITANNRRMYVDQMTETHVRNTLKCILRHAHEGKVWAISPISGGLRHYKKGDRNVATVNVQREPVKPVNAWDEVDQLTITLNTREAKAILAMAGKGMRTGPLHSVYEAFPENLRNAPNSTKLKPSDNGYVLFNEAA